jgi:hypothetical protein
VFLGAASPSYACGTLWTPPGAGSPGAGSPGASSPAGSSQPSADERLGYVQPDMGRGHTVSLTEKVTYLYCPPASGKHYNAAGVAGPIKARVYGPNEKTVPQNWIHNLEHGGLVLLYKCPGDACSDTGQQALNQVLQTFPQSPICHIPPGNIGPVITRFDDMAFPYAALVWDQVLPLDTLDPERVKAFFLQQAERTNPEAQCAQPTAPPPAIPSPVPSAVPDESGSPASPAAS